MAPHSTLHSPRRYERGGVSWVTLLLVSVVAAAVYLFVVWGPVWVLNYEVKQTVRDYMNQAIKNRDDAELIKRMCDKLRSLDTSTITHPDGSVEKVPSVVVDPADVTWERDASASPPMLRVAFEYTRQVRYPFLEKVSEWVGTIDLTNDLTIPNWGPGR
jgi:hypothetical protein